MMFDIAAFSCSVDCLFLSVLSFCGKLLQFKVFPYR